MAELSVTSSTSSTTAIGQTAPPKAKTGYVIQKGDTAYKLAKMFNTTEADIYKRAGTKSLQTGSTINLPQEKFTTSAYAMAKKYNMPAKDFMALNPQITDWSRVKAGTMVNVPVNAFENKENSNSSSTPTPPPKKETKPTPQSTPSNNTPTNNKKIYLSNGKVFTVSALQEEANKVGKANNRPVSRPKPIVDANGKIVADVKIYEPKSRSGPLKGKTIIVNAGHGGYNPKNGSFDPGTYATDKNGKVIEEWYKNTNFTDNLIDDLTSKGAKVIFMSGYVTNVQQAKLKYKSANMFISIHCDSAGSNSQKSGQTIYYSVDSSQKLAKTLEQSLETHSWIGEEKCQTGKKNLGVLTVASSMPSVLIEVGFQSNKKDLANIDSSKYQSDFANLVTQGIINYYNK